MEKTNLKQIFIINQKAYETLSWEYNKLFEKRLPFNQKIAQEFVNNMKRFSDTTKPQVLDIGCSVGIDSYCLSNCDCQVTGIDISPNAISLAKRNVPCAHFVIGNFWQYDFENKFDGIYAQNFIHLFPKETAEQMIIKMAKLIKPRGLIHLTTSKEKKIKDGFHFKTGYSQKVLRYRSFWNQKEIEKAINMAKLKIVTSYLSNKTEEKYPWIIIEAMRKQNT